MSQSCSPPLRVPLAVVTGLADRMPVATADGDLFRVFFERSGIVMATLDARCQILDANDDLFQLFDRVMPEIAGRDFADLLHPGIRSGLRQQFAELTERGHGRFGRHVMATRPDGTRIAGDLTAVAVAGTSRDNTAILVLVTPCKPADVPRTATGQTKVLSELDARILEGIAAGVSTVKLAGQLFLSRQGVEYHVGVMLRRLRATNRSSLVSKACTLGILDVASWPPRVPPEHVM